VETLLGGDKKKTSKNKDIEMENGK